MPGTPVDLDTVTRYLLEAFPGVQTDTTTPDTFFFHGDDHRLPFATLISRDTDFDHASRLDRPGVFRLNLGIGKASFLALFEGPAREVGDLAALDRLMPHPAYGKMYWICVLNPSPGTFERLKPLIAEAHALSARREARARPGL